MTETEAADRLDPFRPAVLRPRLVECLRPDEPLNDGDEPLGDHSLNLHLPPLDVSNLRQAAVLVPLVARGDEVSVLLTRRTEHLPNHAGQIAFPGGKIEARDEGALGAALRESEEEIGLDRAYVDFIGYLDPYLTRTGFRVVPCVGFVRPGFGLVPDPSEVDAVFEVPLRFLMEPANHKRHTRQWQGQERHFHAMPFDEHYIWGVTAGIIRNFYDRFFA